MGEDQLSRYAIYMATLGNRPDLFPDSPYVNKYITGKPGDYEVPGEYLDDETFAAMLAEAQKYIGYPYVWGGSSPATSFDCSGYVSWVINHSGWNVGRLGAQGLYNISTPVSSAKARPGDLDLFRRHLRYTGRFPCGYLCGRRKDAALRRPHPVCRYQHKLLAIPLLRFRATALQLKNDMEVI